jgi:hypothetical protein
VSHNNPPTMPIPAPARTARTPRAVISSANRLALVLSNIESPSLDLQVGRLAAQLDCLVPGLAELARLNGETADALERLWHAARALHARITDAVPLLHEALEREQQALKTLDPSIDWGEGNEHA